MCICVETCLHVEVNSIATLANKYHMHSLLLINNTYVGRLCEKLTVMLTFTYTSDLFIEHLSIAVRIQHTDHFFSIPRFDYVISLQSGRSPALCCHFVI